MKAKSGVRKMTMIKRSEMTFVDLQNQYIKKCKVNNLSKYTIDFYNVSCRTFSKFVDTSELKVTDISRDLIDDYILHLRDTGVKDVTDLIPIFVPN